jgi:hypothetical protein
MRVYKADGNIIHMTGKVLPPFVERFGAAR